MFSGFWKSKVFLTGRPASKHTIFLINFAVQSKSGLKISDQKKEKCHKGGGVGKVSRIIWKAPKVIASDLLSDFLLEIGLTVAVLLYYIKSSRHKSLWKLDFFTLTIYISDLLKVLNEVRGAGRIWLWGLWYYTITKVK